MKKIIYILIPIVLFALYSCESELKPYDQKEDRIDFVFDTKADSTLRHTLMYLLEDKIYDTVWIEMATIGFIYDSERRVQLRQVESELPMAMAGVHYIALDNAELVKMHIVKPNANKASIPIVLLRDPSLKEVEVSLKLELVPNEFFQQGVPKNAHKLILFSDAIIRPAMWDDFMVPYYLCGEYGPVKYQFMVNVLAPKGIIPDNDWFYEVMGGASGMPDMSITDYWKGFFKRELNKENERRAEQELGPLTENDEGETVVAF